MAHLTITSGNSAGAGVSRAFAGQSGASQDATSEPGGLMGLFSALLDNPSASGTAGLTAAGKGKSGIDLAALFHLGLDTADGQKKDDGSDRTDAVAAQAGLTQAIAANPQPMVDFVDALTALKTSLDKGEPLDPKLLEKVQQTLSGLADALGIKLDDLPVPKDFAALLDTTDADKTGLAGTLSQLLAPLAQSLDTATATGTTTAAATDAAGALKALGDKLAALLQALEEGGVSADKLAALGMSPDSTPNEEIEAALARFANSLKAGAVPEEPALATPALKLSETALTGKTDTTDPTAETTSTTPRADIEAKGHHRHAGSDQSDNDRPRERPEANNRQERTAQFAPAPTDASNTPAPSADAGTAQTQATRIDASANPRIVQTGYQTSQQRLNLPQLAFEMARQVNDGNTRFQIRLDPPELGRIDVRLDIDHTGQVHARLTVEKAETLDLMQRDQRGLEKALQQAGLDTGKTNLEFSLKQNPFAGQAGQFDQRQGDKGGNAPAQTGATIQDEAAEPAPMINLYRGSLQASGVNIIA